MSETEAVALIDQLAPDEQRLLWALQRETVAPQKRSAFR